MQFQFDSFYDFFDMAGHGPYVWACYGIAAVALTYIAMTPLWQRRKFLTDLQRTIKLEASEKQSFKAD